MRAINLRIKGQFVHGDPFALTPGTESQKTRVGGGRSIVCGTIYILLPFMHVVNLCTVFFFFFCTSTRTVSTTLQTGFNLCEKWAMWLNKSTLHRQRSSLACERLIV